MPKSKTLLSKSNSQSRLHIKITWRTLKTMPLQGPIPELLNSLWSSTQAGIRVVLKLPW